MKNKYINTRLLSTILSFIIISSGLTGCTNEFLYKRNNDGSFIIEGTINYNNIKDYYVLEVNDKITNTNKIFLVRRIVLNSYKTRYRYIDVFSNIDIFTIEIDNDKKITYYDRNPFDIEDDSLHTFDYIREIPLDYYIITYKKGKYEYTIEDLEELFNIIEEDYYKINNSLENKKVKKVINSLY